MKSPSNTLKEGVSRWYPRQGILLDSPQVIALSGGADSVALLYILQELFAMKGLDRKRLTAAYYNHGLRPPEELSREINLIRELTARWNISLVIGEAQPGELKERARMEKRSLEDLAREFRYAFLDRVIIEKSASYLVLAHHGRDQAETVIYRFFQGSGPAGLRGILPVQGNRIRPLLEFPKSILIEALRENLIPWSEDSTNGDSTILRNGLRESLIPEISRIFPGYENSLTNLSEKMNRYDNCLRKMGESQPWIFRGNDISLDFSHFKNLDPAVREYTLYFALDRLMAGTLLDGGKGRRLPYRFIRPLLEGEPDSFLPLAGYGIRMERQDTRLILKRF